MSRLVRMAYVTCAKVEADIDTLRLSNAGGTADYITNPSRDADASRGFLFIWDFLYISIVLVSGMQS